MGGSAAQAGVGPYVGGAVSLAARVGEPQHFGREGGACGDDWRAAAHPRTYHNHWINANDLLFASFELNIPQSSILNGAYTDHRKLQDNIRIMRSLQILQCQNGQ